MKDYDLIVKRLRYAARMNRIRTKPPRSLTFDCITRESAADAIEELLEEKERIRALLVEFGGLDGVRTYREYAEKYGELLESMPRWISVDEIEPEEGRFYLCSYESTRSHESNGWKHDVSGLSILQYVDGRWSLNDMLYRVTHCMAIPTLPSGEDGI